MAESPVLFLLDKLTSLLQEEVQLLKGVSTEIHFIKDELERLKAILRMADALEDKDPEVKVWVKQVRDVAHDMEDAIDEFTIFALLTIVAMATIIILLSRSSFLTFKVQFD